MIQTLEEPATQVSCSDVSDAECFLKLFDGSLEDKQERLRRINNHINYLEIGDNGKPKEIELLCKKCPVAVMGRLAANNQVEFRVIDASRCPEGYGQGLPEEWAME